MQNPIFKIMAQQDQMMGSSITEEEIQNHKNKIKNLISKLINTHNIDEEISINNEIKYETEFLSSLFRIKRNELAQNKNNNMQMQQQMMAAPQPAMSNMLYKNTQRTNPFQDFFPFESLMSGSTFSQIEGFSVIFRGSGATAEQVSAPIMVQCMPDEKVSEVIEKYRNKAGDHDPNKKFIFNAKSLKSYLTVAEAGLTDNANIFVITTNNI